MWRRLWKGELRNGRGDAATHGGEARRAHAWQRWRKAATRRDVDDGGKKEKERQGPLMYTGAPQRQKQGAHPAPLLHQTSFSFYSRLPHHPRLLVGRDGRRSPVKFGHRAARPSPVTHHTHPGATTSELTLAVWSHGAGHVTGLRRLMSPAAPYIASPAMSMPGSGAQASAAWLIDYMSADVMTDCCGSEGITSTREGGLCINRFNTCTPQKHGKCY